MDNQLIEIRDEDILMQFRMDEQEYVVLCDTEEADEGDTIYFAKIDKIENNFVIRNIEDEDEYNRVISCYEEIIEGMGDIDEQNN